MISAKDGICMDLSPYDSFMRKHLQHYGYYAAKKDDCTSNRERQVEVMEQELSDDSGSPGSDDAVEGLDKESALAGIQDCKTRDELLRTTQIVYSHEDGRLIAHLREPRRLYGFYTSLYGPQQPARWPAGIQVLVDRIRHIQWSPNDPEPFYKPSGAEASPLAISHQGHGRVVFDYEPLVGSFFVRSGVKSSLPRCNEVGVTLESDEDVTLLFESRFESGNLAKAVQVGRYEYELWLRCDLYTDRHTQWYYFRLTNTRANVVYRFTIVNFMKNDSLYNSGMRPLMYSELLAEEKEIGWFRTGSSIKYYKNNITYAIGKCERSYFSLTWTCTFPLDDDTVYFAHCYPYTYSDLQDYLCEVLNDPVKSQFCRQRLLCRSLADNSVYSITITSPSDSLNELKMRKAVVLTARVHPGESNSSWMMKGFLDFLLSDSSDARLLRDNFLFRVVPMLNPDGVIVGNYRCSLTGRDLNRNYRTSHKELFPCIWHTRAMIKRLLDDREIVVYCDLHGHSRRQNMFIYGCENKGNSLHRFHEQIFPYMLAQNAPDVFSFNSSKFHIQKNKEGTGRVVMWSMGIVNSYTLEATFCGSGLGKKKGLHYSARDFESFGYYFCDTLLDYCNPDKTKVQCILAELEEQMKKEIFVRLQQLNANSQDTPNSFEDIDLKKHYLSEFESSDGGSDSSSSDGPPVGLQFLGAKKKKKRKTRRERNQKKTPSSAVKDKRLSTSSLTDRVERKPEMSAAKPVKSAQLINSRRQRSGDRAADEVPRFLQERIEDGNAKRANGHYLEALTEACISEGIRCRNKIPQEVPNLRYTDGLKRKVTPPSGSGKVLSSQSIQPDLERTQKFIFAGCRSDRYIYSAAPSRLCEAYDLNTESIVVGPRPGTAFYSTAAAPRSGPCFQTYSLKIFDRQVQQQRIPGRFAKERSSSEKSSKETSKRLNVAEDLLSNPCNTSVEGLIEGEKKLPLPSADGGILLSKTGNVGLSLPRNPIPPARRKARLHLAETKIEGLSDANSNEKVTVYSQDLSDASKNALHSSTKQILSSVSAMGQSLPSTALRLPHAILSDDGRASEQISLTNFPSTLANVSADLRAKDLQFMNRPPSSALTSSADDAKASGIGRSRTCDDGFCYIAGMSDNVDVIMGGTKTTNPPRNFVGKTRRISPTGDGQLRRRATVGRPGRLPLCIQRQSLTKKQI